VMQMTFAKRQRWIVESSVDWRGINLNNCFYFSFSSSLVSTSTQYNENIKNHNVPEDTEPEKRRKAKFYNNLRLDQCEKIPKTNSKLTRFFEDRRVAGEGRERDRPKN
jgi:hypothetical protein